MTPYRENNSQQFTFLLTHIYSYHMATIKVGKLVSK